VLSYSLKEQLAMLREAEKLGFEIRYIELGNEMYLDWDDYVKRFPTPASYGMLAKRWCKRIKKAFPKALVAVIGTAPLPDDNRPRVKDWNGAVLKKTKAVADESDNLDLIAVGKVGIGVGCAGNDLAVALDREEAAFYFHRGEQRVCRSAPKSIHYP